MMFNWGKNEAKKVLALTRRDMHHWASYKSQAVTTVLGSMIAIASWGFIATFRNVPIPEYQTDYVSYLVVGILINSGILPLARGLKRRIDPWTLETILMTGVRPITFVLGIVAWTYLLSIIFMVPQVLLGIFIFGAVLNVNLLSLAIATIISSTIIFSLAMVTAGIKIVTKVSDPVSWALTAGASLFAGMTFPISHLNNFIPGISTYAWILPHTWIFHIMRQSTLSAASIFNPSIALGFAGATLIAIILFPIGIYTFTRGLRRAKRDGTLGWY